MEQRRTVLALTSCPHTRSRPFTSAVNAWLSVIDKLAIASKHIDLVPQTRTEERRITVQGRGGTVSWNPAAVRFGGSGVHILGAPVDPVTQRIVPTPGVTEKIEVWVSFMLGGHGVNAAGLCKETCSGTRRIATAMCDKFGLSLVEQLGADPP